MIAESPILVIKTSSDKTKKINKDRLQESSQWPKKLCGLVARKSTHASDHSLVASKLKNSLPFWLLTINIRSVASGIFGEKIFLAITSKDLVAII